MSVLIDADAPDGFVVSSFAGDDPIACRDYVRQKIGLAKWEPKKGEEKPKKTVLSTDFYVYQLADKTPYLRVKAVRYSDKSKDFFQFHWDLEDMKWVGGKPQGPKIPYRLPELLDHADEPIWIVEGEKAADAIRKRGLVATTSSEGAGKFTPDLARWFEGRDVYVVPDNDLVGRKHAQDVLQAIPHAILVDIPNRPAKAGLDDWFEAGGTIEALWAMADEPPVPQSVRDDAGDAGASDGHPPTDAEKPAKSFTRERFHEIQPGNTEWLIKHFLPAQGVGIVYGKSTVGKSFFALKMCLNIARGDTFLGHKTRQAGVLYFAAEGQNGMRKRIKGVRDQLGVHAPAFQFIGDTLNLMDAEHVLALGDAACDAREDMAENDLSLGLIVIDTTAASMPGGNENAGEDMSMVLQAAQIIGQRANCMVLFIAHPGKNEALGVRGWSGQTGNVGAVYYLAPSDDDPALRVGVVQKLKDGEDGERFAYRLEQIHMGIDDDGDDITTAHPVFEDPPASSNSRKKKRPEDRPGPAIIMRAIYQMIEAGQSCPAPNVPGVPLGQMAVYRRDVRERVIQLGYADADDRPETIKRSVNRDIVSLLAANTLREEGEIIWPLR